MEIPLALGLFAVLLIILLIGVPVAFALAFVSIAALFLLEGGFPALGLVASTAYSTVASFVLIAVPLYIFMGAIISRSGMGSRLYAALSKILHGVPGGLAIATTLACGLMAAVSGSSVGTAGAVGQMSVEEMRKHGYNSSGACGAVAAGGTLGIIIPPSIPMIVYGIISEQSIAKLFIGGVIPGIILVSVFSSYQLWRARSGSLGTFDDSELQSITLKERFSAFLEVFPTLILIVIILGSIYGGLATPSEAAALGVVASLLLGGLFYRELTWEKFWEILKGTANATVMVTMIIVGAMLLGYVLTTTNIASGISHTVASMPVSRWFILIAINFLLIFLGCFMETISIIVITLPILAPIIISLGWNLIWFGVIMTINMEMALITPPVGLNLYVVQGVVKTVQLEEIIRGSLPYVLLMAIVIILVAVFPQLALWLPGMIRQ
jgi:C4-dicarboxylate transporter DctM subunit